MLLIWPFQKSKNVLVIFYTPLLSISTTPLLSNKAFFLGILLKFRPISTSTDTKNIKLGTTAYQNTFKFSVLKFFSLIGYISRRNLIICFQSRKDLLTFQLQHRLQRKNCYPSNILFSVIFLFNPMLYSCMKYLEFIITTK